MLTGVIGFVVRNPASTQSSVRQSAFQATGDITLVANNPLDQLSSADIAVHVAQMTNLEEAVNVVNHADSVNQQLMTASGDMPIIAKPQIVSTNLKSKRDIKKYITVAGDTVSNLATKFGITSDSIRWSNNLISDALVAGKELLIMPSGQNGIVVTVKQGDTVDSLAQRYRANKDQIIAFNDAEIEGLKVGEVIGIPDGTIFVPTSPSTAPRSFAFGNSAIYGYNGYSFGWCTWWAAKRRADVGHPVPANLGDAWTWSPRASAAGITVSDTPIQYAVINHKTGYPGHVAFVEEVLEDGSIWVSDMNYFGQVSPTDTTRAGGWNHVSWRKVSPSEFGKYRFIHW